jgi:retinol dehydrogenase-12
MKLTPSLFLREQLATVPPIQHEDLSGKTVVVIGANVGLGFEAAIHFARMNPDRIILGCRSKERGEAAASSETNLLLSFIILYLISNIKN